MGPAQAGRQAMSRSDYWFLVTCVLGLSAAVHMHTLLYRRLRDEVEFLMVITPVPHETEYPQ
jgi:hypothetical protein